MFTNVTLSTSNWLQQKDHGSSIYTRPVLDSFSFGSRWVLVRSSFVSRSSLVAYSLVYRRPNEDRTRNRRKTNERATNVGRENSEKLSKIRRETAQLDGKGSFLAPNVKPNEQNWITFVLTGLRPNNPHTQGITLGYENFAPFGALVAYQAMAGGGMSWKQVNDIHFKRYNITVS